MSWLIEEESIDRLVLDDIGGNDTDQEVMIVQDDGELIEHNDANVDIIPPMDVVNVRNSSTALSTAPNIIFDADQESVHSGITILPSCSSSSRNVQLITTMQDSTRVVSMIDETDVALSINPFSIDSSILTDFSGSRCLSSVNSVESRESLIELETVNDEMSYTSESEHNNSMRQRLNNQLEINRWYENFESEENWDEFQEKAKVLLDAIECPTEEREEMIAQLISIEEQVFWNSNGDQIMEEAIDQPKLSWMLEVAALSASIALAGVVLVRFIRSR